jgi:hypothetical protein
VYAGRTRSHVLMRAFALVMLEPRAQARRGVLEGLRLLIPAVRYAHSAPELLAKTMVGVRVTAPGAVHVSSVGLLENIACRHAAAVVLEN